MVFNINNAMKTPYIIAIMVVIIIIWAFLFHIEGGIRVSGIITPVDNKQIISHLEGGIVQKVFVKEGDNVKKGQALLIIENLSFSEKINKSEKLIDYFNAKIARIQSELSQQKFIYDKNNPHYLTELELYNRRKSQLKSEISVLKRKITENNAELLLLAESSELLAEEILVLEQDYKIAKELKKLGASSSNEVASSEKDVIRAKNKLNKIKLNINKASNNILQLKDEIIVKKDTFLGNSQDELDKTMQKLNKAQEEYNIVKTREARSVLRAVNDGVVLKIWYGVKGMVVKGGNPIIEIVANNTNNIVVARVKVEDRDKIWINMDAQIMISHWSLPSKLIVASIVDIGADSIINDKTNEAYYKIKVIPKYKKDKVYNQLLPGMVVQTLLVSGNHSIANYFISPILKDSNKIMSEAIFIGK